MARQVLVLVLLAACSGKDKPAGEVPTDTGTATTPPPAVCEPGLAAVRGPDSFATVGEAISTASTGDEVRICPGDWTVEGTVSSGEIAIVGDSGSADDAILRPGPSQGTALRFLSSTSVSLTALTFEGATTSAVELPSVRQLFITDCVFRDNAGDVAGGAIAAQLIGDPTTPTTLRITGSTFEGNTAPQGGALELVATGGATARIEDTTFAGNNATSGGGGAVYLQAAGGSGNEGIVEGSTFTDNTASGDGGAVAFSGPGDLRFTDTEATGNTAGSTGGAYAMLPLPTPDPSAVTLEGGRIAANVAGHVLSGAVHLQPGWTMTVDGTDLAAYPEDNVPKDINVCPADYDGPTTITVGPGGCQ